MTQIGRIITSKLAVDNNFIRHIGCELFEPVDWPAVKSLEECEALGKELIRKVTIVENAWPKSPGIPL